MLEKRKLGSTNLEVSVLALGGLPLSTVWAKGAGPEIIRRAAELGINFIDTAPSYHDSESVIGEALRKLDAEFYIGTKLGRLPAQDYRPQDKEFLRRELNDSLKRLNRSKVDIVYIHEPDRPEFYQWWSNSDTYDGAVMEMLAQAREEGKLDFIGLGGTTTLEMARLVKSGKFDVVLSAFQYSLLWREAEYSVFPAAAEQKMGLIAGSPLQQGALAKIYYHDIVEEPMRWLSAPRRKQFMELYELVHDCGIPLPELALRFVLSNPLVTSVLTGVDSVERLENNVESAMKGPLPAELLEKLQNIYDLVPFRPFGEPFSLSFAENIKAIEEARKKAEAAKK